MIARSSNILLPINRCTAKRTTIRMIAVTEVVNISSVDPPPDSFYIQ